MGGSGVPVPFERKEVDGERHIRSHPVPLFFSSNSFNTVAAAALSTTEYQPDRSYSRE